ncbi:glycosyltransferase family 2 protein [bacterium]|nr:glycosyltransferase family 2 protein [bacterium]
MLTVSVVIPARNDGAALGTAVESIRTQQDVVISEIAIAVGPSTDDTKAEANRLAATDPGILVLDNPTGLTPAGLNIAIANTTGDVVVRVDARSQLPPDYIKHALETMNATGAANVGAIQEAAGQTPTERAIAAAMHSKLGSGGARYRHGGDLREVETAYLGVFSRKALEDVDGFDESFIRNQDSELNIRLRNAGHTVWLDPRMVVEYRPRPSLRALASQYWQYGWWRAITLRRHPGSMKLRQAAVPLAVLALVASLVVGLAIQPWFLVIPAAYLGSLVVAAASEPQARTLREKATMVAALATMHVMWGTALIASTAVHLVRGPK